MPVLLVRPVVAVEQIEALVVLAVQMSVLPVALRYLAVPVVRTMEQEPVLVLQSLVAVVVRSLAVVAAVGRTVEPVAVELLLVELEIPQRI